MSAKSAAYSETGTLVREKKYIVNQKKLAERLERERPSGLAGLQYVLVELRLAQ